jgi:ADP-ribose pyrophosphatase YjhB (NUDIX family)
MGTRHYCGMGDRAVEMNFCTQCGTRLARRYVKTDRRQRDICSVCGTIHYENPRLLVACYVHCRERVVLCRRAQQPAMGLWAPPAGFVENGETLQEAAVREVVEETGISLEPQRLELFRLMSLPHMNEVYVEFRAELNEEPVVAPGPEAMDVALFSQMDVPRDLLAFANMIPAYPDEFFECLRRREFPIKLLEVRPVG